MQHVHVSPRRRPPLPRASTAVLNADRRPPSNTAGMVALSSGAAGANGTGTSTVLSLGPAPTSSAASASMTSSSGLSAHVLGDIDNGGGGCTLHTIELAPAAKSACEA